MTIERRIITDRQTWLEWRKRDVTASSIGALFGVHPYSTALRLYAEKRGTEFAPLDDDNKLLRRGRWLEPSVAKAVSELRPDWKLEAPNVYLRDPELRLGCTPDFLIKSDPRGLGVLQAKTCAASVYEREWLSGEEPPMWIVLQTLTEMMLCEATHGAVAVLKVDAFDMTCDVIDVPRHPPSEDKIRSAVANFWQQVANGIEPEPDFARDAETIKALSPRETAGKRVDFSGHNALPQMLADRAAYMAVIEDAEEKKKTIENEIKYLLGDAESAIGLDGWRITYKMTDYKAYSVPARSTRVLRIQNKRVQS